MGRKKVEFSKKCVDVKIIAKFSHFLNFSKNLSFGACSWRTVDFRKKVTRAKFVDFGTGYRMALVLVRKKLLYGAGAGVEKFVKFQNSKKIKF